MPEELAEGRRFVLDALFKGGMAEAEAELKLEADFNDWLEDTTPGAPLPFHAGELLRDAAWFKSLANPDRNDAPALYSAIIDRLVDGRTIGRRTAAVTASYLPLIARLASDFRFSSAGVADVINESDKRVSLHWKGIDKMLKVLGFDLSLDERKVNALLERDRESSRMSFGDADVPTIVEMLRYEASLFELGGDFDAALGDCLLPRGENAFVPYLQTLFYICTITEYFDHPPEYLYTFRPRGKVANTIFSVFPSEMAAAGNPILNNFKAIDRLSSDWANPRDDHPDQARALVALTEGLSSLSYSSRRYLAAVVRRGLFRYIEIRRPEPLKLGAVGSIGEVRHFLEAVARGETNTCGIVEQRATDFLASLSYREPQWRSRGLGDPVNETNTASGKLGDADFQDAADRRCVAVEAHAGRLTPIYIAEHLRTLRRNLPKRIAEWEAIADLADWSLEVVFVVHANGCDSDELPLAASAVNGRIRARSLLS